MICSRAWGRKARLCAWQSTLHYAQWFERMLAEQGHQLWVGDAAEIRAAMTRVMLAIFWTCCSETSFRQLQAMAMGQGICRKKKLSTAVGRKELQGLSLGPWASRRRQELLDLLDRLKPVMDE